MLVEREIKMYEEGLIYLVFNTIKYMFENTSS